MKRINLLIDETMFDHLKSLPGTMTEHIRQAIYKYLLELSTQSMSSSKKGGENG
jgi:hypothetical protein